MKLALATSKDDISPPGSASSPFAEMLVVSSEPKSRGEQNQRDDVTLLRCGIMIHSVCGLTRFNALEIVITGVFILRELI
jgi:hypothetical protein